MKSTYRATGISLLAYKNDYSSRSKLTTTSVPDSGAAPQMSTSLDSLPAELFDRIARKLYTKSLYALRFTCKSVEKMALSSFANRAFRQVTVWTDPRSLQAALNDFKRLGGDESFRVRIVDILKGFVISSQDADAVSAAIVEFCRKLTHLRCLIVRTSPRQNAASPYLSTILETISTRKLARVNLSNCTLSLKSFRAFLASRPTLISVELNRVYHNHRQGVEWSDIFYSILTELNLESLTVSKLHSDNQLYKLLSEDMRRIEHRAKNSQTPAKSSREYYHVRPISAVMGGVMGVKAGIKRILAYKGVDVP